MSMRNGGGRVKIPFDEFEKRKMQQYIRAGVVSLDEVLPYIVHRNTNNLAEQRRKYCGHEVKMVSGRLNTFVHCGIKCVKCGIEGKFFAVERDRGQEKFHLNLYALDEDGDEVLMTKDHIVPLAKGGRNVAKNYQTMCCLCNEEKADKLEDEGGD
jgi:hypothetical protein